MNIKIKHNILKVAISSFANTGAYGFPSASCLRDTCEKILDEQYSPEGL